MWPKADKCGVFDSHIGRGSVENGSQLSALEPSCSVVFCDLELDAISGTLADFAPYQDPRSSGTRLTLHHCRQFEFPTEVISRTLLFEYDELVASLVNFVDQGRKQVQRFLSLLVAALTRSIQQQSEQMPRRREPSGCLPWLSVSPSMPHFQFGAELSLPRGGGVGLDAFAQ